MHDDQPNASEPQRLKVIVWRLLPGRRRQAGLSDLHADAAVDPTRHAQRHRKRSHHRRYRLAILLTGLSIAALIAAAIVASLGDRSLGYLLTAAALLLALPACIISARNCLSARVLGPALAAGLLALLAGGALWLSPGHWFDDHPQSPPAAHPP